MTQQYLAGELSLRLGQVLIVAADDRSLRDLTRLRHQVENVPVMALGPLADRALETTDAMSWLALARGDAAAFSRLAELGAELYEFGVCARLLRDSPLRHPPGGTWHE